MNRIGSLAALDRALAAIGAHADADELADALQDEGFVLTSDADDGALAHLTGDPVNDPRPEIDAAIRAARQAAYAQAAAWLDDMALNTNDNAVILACRKEIRTKAYAEQTTGQPAPRPRTRHPFQAARAGNLPLNACGHHTDHGDGTGRFCLAPATAPIHAPATALNEADHA